MKNIDFAQLEYLNTNAELIDIYGSFENLVGNLKNKYGT
jgi:hypothetical protein